jgi:flagellum-specific peptidoglycan hydrolase FlgJ
VRPQDFIAAFQPFMGPVKSAGLFPSVCIAQAALETGWGTQKSELYPNFWGRKWHYGEGISSMTREVEEGENVWSDRDFQKYGSIEEAVEDYIWLFFNHPKFVGRVNRYSRELFIESMSPLYATDAPEEIDGDPSYAEKISNIILRYDIPD